MATRDGCVQAPFKSQLTQKQIQDVAAYVTQKITK